MDNAVEVHCDDLDRAISSLKLLSTHDALLLRACFSAPKLMQILRCSPCSDNTRLIQFDLSLCQGRSVITNTDLTDSQWIQASLPVRSEGLRVRRVATFTSSAFLAVASTCDLQSQLLLNCHPAPDPQSTLASCCGPHLITYHCLMTPVTTDNMLEMRPSLRLIRLPCGQVS